LCIGPVGPHAFFILYLPGSESTDNSLLNSSLITIFSAILIGLKTVVSAGGRQAINASSPARTLRSVAEREQLGVMVRGN